MEGTSNAQKEVVVIGGGLVGALQATLLGQRGFRVRLYESRPDLRSKKEVSGRSINITLSNRGREALRAVDLEQVVLDRAIPMRARKIHPVSSRTYAIPYATRGECIYSIDRSLLNELLLTKAEEIPTVSLHFEHRLIRADLVEKELTFQTGDANAKDVAVEIDFVFGCDGVHSTIRRQMMRWGSLNYSQEYTDLGYKELTLPTTKDGHYAVEPNFLHIWPREEFMMIALPNLDRSFTLTLFMPFKVFDAIETEEDVLAFFTKYFPDVVEKIGVDTLLRDYFKHPLGNLISVKCFPHFMAKSTLILGDAAHAVVPFYGQGMNAGFEDCLIFYNLLEQSNNDLCIAAQSYQDSHWEDMHTICDLSVYNYLEIRSHVNSTFFLLWKKLDNFLHFLFPHFFVPLYTMIAFTRIPYHRIMQRHMQQQNLIKKGLWFLSISSLALAGYLLFKFSGL